MWCVVFGVWFGVRVRCVVSVCGVWSVVVVPVVCGGLRLVCNVWCYRDAMTGWFIDDRYLPGLTTRGGQGAGLRTMASPVRVYGR